MLVGIPVITHIMVEVVHIGKKQIVFGKDKGATHVDGRKTNGFWVFDRKYFFVFVGEAAPGFVTQVETGVFIANDFGRVLYIDGSVVCGED